MKPARFETLVLGIVVPPELQEAFAGDLLEESAQREARGSSPAATRRWRLTQILRSLPAMLRYRVCRDAPRVRRLRLLATLISAAMGAVQAYDSGLHRSSAAAIALVAIALLLSTVTILLTSARGALFVALLVSLALVFTARVISPLPLPELGLVVFPLWLWGLFGTLLLENAAGSGRTTGPTAPGTT